MIQTLIVIEHDGHAVRPATLNAISLAREIGGAYALLVLGSDISGVTESVRRFGAEHVWVADDPGLAEPLADRHAPLIVEAVRQSGARTLAATASTYSKDVFPRAAALLDAPMISDVSAVQVTGGRTCFQHPVSAGCSIALVSVEGETLVLTARSTAFSSPTAGDDPCPVGTLEFDFTSLPSGMQFVSREQPTSTRPDLGEARIVVTGGRPLRDKETFERLIGGLADALGGAVGATRAAVDAGMVANQFQVGQTATTVAPELYIAVGVSGALQHLAGIRDAKVIVAINRDPEAPIFQSATYGLVGDLYEIVPRLIEELGR